MFAVFAPGQGAQTPGMLSPWLELPGVEEQVGTLGEAVGLDLIRLGSTAGADEIRDTAITQPLIVALGVVSADQLGLRELGLDTVIAGHSVGELTAAAVAGALSEPDAVNFAAHRGQEMAAACALANTGMSAVLGGDRAEVLAAIDAAGLTAANQNGSGQIVAAGAREGLDRLAAEPPAGARVRPLEVAGAFHTHYMATAEQALADYSTHWQMHDPHLTLLSNAAGQPVRSGTELLSRLIAQVTRPVRWDACLQTCAELGVEAAIELAPAGALIGIAKRELRGVELLAVKSPNELDAARTLLQLDRTDEPDAAMTVASYAEGIFSRAAGVAERGEVGRGTRLGTVNDGEQEHPIISPHGGVLLTWLCADGAPVTPGTALASVGSGLGTR